MEDIELMTTQEVARELGVSDSHVRSMVRTGKAQPVRQVGGTWMFTREEVERLRERKRRPGPDPKK